MPRPLNAPNPPSQELRHFTNREKERDVLRRVLAITPSKPLPVVMFYGVGGTGKSWLLRKLREEMPRFIPSALLDLEPRSGGTPYHTDSSRSLAYLRGQFKEIECPRFDLAYVWLRHKEGVTDEPILKGGGPAGTAAEALTDFASSAAEGLPLVGWFVKKLKTKIKEKFVGTRLESWLANTTGQSDFLRLRGMSAQDIYPELARRLLTDLAEGLPPWVGHACRGVVFLDTVEALRVGIPGDAQGHERESWLRELVAPDSPILLVLAGRDRLRWADADPDFTDSELMEQHLVGGLSETDSRLFLTRCGVVDAPLQDAILRASVDTESEPEDGERGYHPFSLGLCVDSVQAEQARGLTVDPKTFDIRPGDSARLAQRFLKSLADPAHELWVHRLALTPRFDEAAARAAYSEGPGAAQDAAWQGLLRYSFIRETGEPGICTLHTRMRDALADPTSRGEFSNHQVWEKYWRGRSVGECDVWAGLAWYHRFHLDASRATSEWKDMAMRLRKTRKMTEHFQLIGWWEPTGLPRGNGLTETTASLLLDFVSELCEVSLGSSDKNLREAIACYRLIESVYTEADFPRYWALTQTNLGFAYSNLPTGDRVENLREAICYCTAALRVFNVTDFPQHWALTQANLALAHLGLPTGDFGENLREAISCYTAALRVFNVTDFPQHWALTQANLGLAHLCLPTGDRVENLRKAIHCNSAALQVFTEADFPRYWARTQTNLGVAHSSLPTGDRVENLREAICCYTTALRVYTEADFPRDWALTQTNLGAAHLGLPTGDRVENLREAIRCYAAALRVFTVADLPQQWASTQTCLGVAHLGLPTGDRVENLRVAIRCCTDALQVFTEANYPRDWALTQTILAEAHASLPTGDLGENQREAIRYCTAALRVLTETDLPQQWAMTQTNLGLAYSRLLTGDQRENQREAIRCWTAALRVFTEADFPVEWARTQSNLGVAYANLPGFPGENLREAIRCSTTALRVYTEADFPVEWARTQSNLGVAYANLPGFPGENLREAIRCYTAALRVFTEADFPVDWARTMSNLGEAHAGLPSGDRGENLLEAIRCCNLALRVFTELDFPGGLAETQKNLGTAYWSSFLHTTNPDLKIQAVVCFEAAVRGYASCGLEKEREEAEAWLARIAAEAVEEQRPPDAPDPQPPSN
jgi:tetratricopeptide (TPR) repeat protein